jgi:malonyl-CoA O-methyltransferase
MGDSDHANEEDSSFSRRMYKRMVSRSFGSAAPRYDGFARLQTLTGDRLLGFVAEQRSAHRLLDAGAGTGALTGRLGELYPSAKLIALDLAEGMARHIRYRFPPERVHLVVCADCEALPLADNSVDIVFSNLTLQWCTDLSAVFSEFCRILTPTGVLAFSTFGGDTLKELRLAWQAVDRYTHVNRFTDEQSLRRLLQRAGLREAKLESSAAEIQYPSVYHLMRELKGLGAHNVTAGRPRHLTGKGSLRKMISAYEGLMQGGQVMASFEVIRGLARPATTGSASFDRQ